VAFCEHGALLSWLATNGSQSSRRTLYTMALDVSNGMSYLESLGIVHRDMAARNVLVSSDLSCKVSDFGLSRVSDDGTTQVDAKDQVAIRWAAPEAFTDRKYSSKSDVWSYGVVLYEIFTFGRKPYEDWKNRRVIEEIKVGNRMERSPLCPEEIYELMLSTWHADPEQRPTFRMLSTSLNALMLALEEKPQEVGTNKLIAQFNAVKDRIQTSSANYEADYGGSMHASTMYASVKGRHRSQKSRREANNTNSICASPSTLKKSANNKQSIHGKASPAVSPAPIRPAAAMKASAKGKAPQRMPTYLDLIGCNGNVITATDKVTTPSVFGSNGTGVPAAGNDNPAFPIILPSPIETPFRIGLISPFFDLEFQLQGLIKFKTLSRQFFSSSELIIINCSRINRKFSLCSG
jgi:serine/threonine protein kinase